MVSILFVTVLFGIGANGLGWLDYSSSSETDSTYNPDNDLGLYDDDTDDRISFDDLKRLFNIQTSSDEEKWNEIDNLELIDYTQDDQFVEMVQHSEVHGIMMYTLGKRVRGDKLVASSAKNQTWSQYQDIKSNMTYPANGVIGRNLTYVEIQVNQITAGTCSPKSDDKGLIPIKTKNESWENVLHPRNNPAHTANRMGTLMYSTRSETSDITFIIGSTEIKAHKAVLAAFSPKYMAQFYTHFSVENPIKVKDVSAAAFEEFLQFFYLETVNLTHKNITDVLTLAAESTEEFFDECFLFLSDTLTSDNVCQCYHLAVKYNNDDLIEKCERKISSDSYEVFLSDTFLSCTAGDLFNILQLDSLNCKETDVFDACILWAVNCGATNGLDSEKVEDIRKILTDENLPGQLLHQIRFGAMSIEEFMNCYKNYKQLFTEDEREEILYMIGKVNNSEPKRFNDESRLVPYKKWCEEDSILCYRVVRANEKESFRFGINETVFSTNRPFLLGGFSCGSLLEKKSNGTQNDQQPEEKCVTTGVSLIRKHAIGDKDGKTLFNTTEKLAFKAKDEAFFKLQRPIMIKPTFVYEIHLDFKEGFSVKDYEFKNEVVLRPKTSHTFSNFGAPVNEFNKKDEDRTVVKFCETNGLVTGLNLNICVE
ncbi:hypothetical protein HA402_003709 [Bradysia odoriphaga]|nr:hypothetical protein HA402_003709 [Bradysia odoriphaga]